MADDNKKAVPPPLPAKLPREEIAWTPLDDALADRAMADNRKKGIRWPSDVLRREAEAAARTQTPPAKHA